MTHKELKSALSPYTLLLVQPQTAPTDTQKKLSLFFTQIQTVALPTQFSLKAPISIAVVHVDTDIATALQTITAIQAVEKNAFIIATAPKFSSSTIAKLLDLGVTQMLVSPLDLEKLLHVLLLFLQTPQEVPNKDALKHQTDRIHTMIYEIQMEGDFSDTHKEMLIEALDGYAKLLYNVPEFAHIAKEFNKLDQSIEHASDIFNHKIQKVTVLFEELTHAMQAWCHTPYEKTAQETVVKGCKKIIATLRP